ncbi:MAG: DUF104 domain-containing protein [Nanoarchaeota archaeon]|nr:DUF104 domain-containing protein [Nanoarchaeota archaeon]
MAIKARFEKGHFVPLENEDVAHLDNGNVVEIEIIQEDNILKWKGALKHIKKNSVEFQHSIKDKW